MCRRTWRNNSEKKVCASLPQLKASAGALEYMAVAKVSNLTLAVDELKRPVYGFMPRRLTGRLYIKPICTGPPLLSSEARERNIPRFALKM